MSKTTARMGPEELAQLFHETYERLAPEHGYETRKASAVPWPEVPESNRELMVAVAAHVLTVLPPAVVELPPLDDQVDVLSSLLAHLRMRLEWIERGANYEQADVRAVFSPGQVWARLLRNTAEVRLLWIEGVIAQAESAGRCWMTQHDRTIEQQHERIVKLEQRITDLGGDLP